MFEHIQHKVVFLEANTELQDVVQESVLKRHARFVERFLNTEITDKLGDQSKSLVMMLGSSGH